MNYPILSTEYKPYCQLKIFTLKSQVARRKEDALMILIISNVPQNR